MMNEALLIRYLNHTCSPSEMNRVEQWMNEDKNHAEYIFEAERIWNLKHELYYSDGIVLEKAFSKIKDRIDKPEIFKGTNKNLLRLFWWQLGVAAVIIVLLVMNLSQKNNSQNAVAQVWNTISVPRGHISSVVLSDGTKITLNSETVLRYPSLFNEQNRVVELEGEALFEVNHSDTHPFIVKTEKLTVRDLGTVFDLKAYPSEQTFVSLSEGKVEVESIDKRNKITLKPNEMVFYTESVGMTLKQVSDARSVSSWIGGEGTYKDMKLEDICNDLERRYGVDIIIDNPSLKNEIFTCHYKEGTSIIQIMNLLKYTKKLDFSEKQGTILITKP